MIALYLDYQLDEEELSEVSLAIGEEVEPLRIPWLRTDRDGAPPLAADFLPHMRHLGVGDLVGDRVLLVAPAHPDWYVGLAQAVYESLGTWPLLVQPSVRRAAVDCPGPLRVIDMDAYLAGGDAATKPPWLEE